MIGELHRVHILHRARGGDEEGHEVVEAREVEIGSSPSLSESGSGFLSPLRSWARRWMKKKKRRRKRKRKRVDECFQ